MQMVRIRRFGVIKTATVAAAMYFVLIVIGVLLFAPFVAIVTVSVPEGVTRPPGLDPGTGIIGLLIGGLFIAILYAVIGWIFTALACLLYNFVAGYVGGIEVQLENVTLPPAPNWGPTTGTTPTRGQLTNTPAAPPSNAPSPPANPPPPPSAPTGG
jgi:hypothetical protein